MENSLSQNQLDDKTKDGLKSQDSSMKSGRRGIEILKSASDRNKLQSDIAETWYDINTESSPYPKTFWQEKSNQKKVG